MTAALLLLVAVAADAPPGCRSCHEAQALQWERSLHASASVDPLVKAMREWAQADAGDAVAAKCATCHSVPLVDGSARSAMVTCEACHQGQQLGPGAQGWAVDPSRPVRSRNPATAAPHAVVADPALTNGGICLVCHAEMLNPAGLAVCTTGPEHAARHGAATCVDCHAGGGDHRFDGTSAAMLSRAASLSLEFGAGTAVVSVANRGAGHALPTGSALREVVLDLAFFAADGGVLWSNRDDARARFARAFKDAAGNSPVPPWRAVAEARDTRLASGEARLFAYPIPAGAARVEARLVFHRAPAAIAARLGLTQEPLLQPVVMAQFSREIPAVH